MDRVSSTGYQTIGGIRTWQNANEGAGIQGTTFDQIFFAGVQESIVQTILKSGQTPTDSTLGAADTQLLAAVLAFAGANVQAVNSTPGSALPAISSGLVVVNATSGNISITLPPSNGLGGTVQEWKFVRTDATSNTVSIALHAGDTTMVTGSGGPLSLGPLAQLTLTGDGTAHWLLSQSVASAGGFYSDTGTANAMVVSFNPAPSSLAAIQGQIFIVQKNVTNTGNVSLNLNGLGGVQVLFADGSQIPPGMFPATTFGLLSYNAGSNTFFVLNIPDPTLLATIAYVIASLAVETARAEGVEATKAPLPAGWTPVTGSRALGTVYTNSTGKPLKVSAWGTASGSTNLNGYVNSAEVVVGSSSPTGTTTGVYFEVPVGATYEVNYIAGSVALAGWTELS